MIKDTIFDETSSRGSLLKELLIDFVIHLLKIKFHSQSSIFSLRVPQIMNKFLSHKNVVYSVAIRNKTGLGGTDDIRQKVLDSIDNNFGQYFVRYIAH